MKARLPTRFWKLVGSEGCQNMNMDPKFGVCSDRYQGNETLRHFKFASDIVVAYISDFKLLT